VWYTRECFSAKAGVFQRKSGSVSAQEWVQAGVFQRKGGSVSAQKWVQAGVFQRRKACIGKSVYITDEVC